MSCALCFTFRVGKNGSSANPGLEAAMDWRGNCMLLQVQDQFQQWRMARWGACQNNIFLILIVSLEDTRLCTNVSKPTQVGEFAFLQDIWWLDTTSTMPFLGQTIPQSTREPFPLHRSSENTLEQICSYIPVCWYAFMTGIVAGFASLEAMFALQWGLP